MYGLNPRCMPLKKNIHHMAEARGLSSVDILISLRCKIFRSKNTQIQELPWAILELGPFPDTVISVPTLLWLAPSPGGAQAPRLLGTGHAKRREKRLFIRRSCIKPDQKNSGCARHMGLLWKPIPFHPFQGEGRSGRHPAPGV